MIDTSAVCPPSPRRHWDSCGTRLEPYNETLLGKKDSGKDSGKDSCQNSGLLVRIQDSGQDSGQDSEKDSGEDSGIVLRILTRPLPLEASILCAGAHF